MAMGASRLDVIGSVLRTGLTPVFGGLLAGLGIAALVGRALQGLLYDVPPADLPSLGAAGLLLVTVATVAVWAPTLRATRVDPAAILNDE